MAGGPAAPAVADGLALGPLTVGEEHGVRHPEGIADPRAHQLAEVAVGRRGDQCVAQHAGTEVGGGDTAGAGVPHSSVSLRAFRSAALSNASHGSPSRALPVQAADYRTQVVSTSGGPVLASSGLSFSTTALPDVAEPVDTLVVAGGSDLDEACADQELLRSVRQSASSARRITSVCSGAFVLAAAGLLDGRRATTHRAECELLETTYPEVSVDLDAIHVRDGEVWTSAGVTSGIDLALALVAEDHGARAAAAVARHLVVHLRRSGGQAQFSTLPAAQAAESEPVRELLAWLPDHLDADLTLPALARRVHLSERHLSRVFKAEVHVTPGEHVEELRLEAACRLLETTGHAVEHIARLCGFGAPETMNRAFRRRLDTTPGDHRRTFGHLAVP